MQRLGWSEFWSEFCWDHGLSFLPRGQKHWGRGRRVRLGESLQFLGSARGIAIANRKNRCDFGALRFKPTLAANEKGAHQGVMQQRAS